MRLYFSAVFQHKLTGRSQKTKPLFSALLHTHNKAAAAFEKCGFISARSFNTKQPGGYNDLKPLCQQKAAIHTSAAAFEKGGFMTVLK